MSTPRIYYKKGLDRELVADETMKASRQPVIVSDSQRIVMAQKLKVIAVS
jgi:hypothetical protein